MSGSNSATVTIKGDPNNPIASTTDVTADVNADVTAGLTVGGGPNPVALQSTSDMAIGGGDRPLATEVTLHLPDPVRTDSKADLRSASEIAITRPIETRSDMRLDVQPVVVDLCLTANIGKIPRLAIRRPYDHHLRLRVLGVEVLCLDLTGQGNFLIEDLPRRPDVAWGAEHHRPEEGGGHPQGHEREWMYPAAAPSGQAHPKGAGLRIGLGP
jgi:hypothetical protein